MAKTKLEKLKEKVKKAPRNPGVYIWRNKKRAPIYIGRASNIKSRLSSYFSSKDRRIREMLERAQTLEWKKSDTLLEAVILEANLIKKHWPKYNVQEKDDKSFIYLVILKGEFPKPILVRGRELEKYTGSKEGNKSMEVFGPYKSYRLLRTALELVRPVFPYSSCKAGSTKPCFHYQIGLCPGVCIDKADKEEYKRNIKNLILFFRGDKKRLFKKLKKENPAAIKALEQVNDTALLSQSSSLLSRSSDLAKFRIEGYDISHLSGSEPVGAMVVFENSEKDPSQYRLFKIRSTAQTQDDLGMLKEMIERRLKHKEWPMADIIFIDGGLNQVRAAASVLKMFQIFLPVVGLSKAGRHSASAASEDKMVILGAKKIGKELLLANKKLFQQVRDEAHRFAIAFQRRRRRLK
ncbi:MAG: GIY-YIG nuclease family protein [Candidatus Harrisonbacteria bacterium]|nr:GIY-YIG nuclease family protein [Candidatus Harrisonbacteria bacterium]